MNNIRTQHGSLSNFLEIDKTAGNKEIIHSRFTII